MIYLLDVNALIALGVARHEFHDRVSNWVHSEIPSRLVLATCSITELGFVRVLSQIPKYDLSVNAACSVFWTMRDSNSKIPFQFLQDGNTVGNLPSWFESPKQVTDGHLLQLATTHLARLATLDENIPNAF